MEFNWSKFTQNDFVDYCAKMENGMYDPDYKMDANGEYEGQYIGCIHVGELCFDLVLRLFDGALHLDFDLYILGVNNGYGYTVNDEPYTADGGGSFYDTMISLSYDQFQKLAEGIFEEFIRNEGSSVDGFSLVEKANKETRIW